MIDFSNVKGVSIGGNAVKKIMRGSDVLWESGGEEPPVLLSWEHVLWSIENNRYTTDYAIGDLIPTDLGTEGNINMQIVAFDADDLADGTGKAHISFISKELLNTSHRMNPELTPSAAPYDEGTGAIGGWEKSEMRAYMKETIKPLIPSEVRFAIVEVTKTSYAYDTAGMDYRQTTQDDVWLPSTRDLAYSDKKETSGPMYSEMFPDIASHKKYKVGSTSATNWWLRSAGNTRGNFCYVTYNSGGWNFGTTAINSYGVALGFCL